MLFSGLQGLYGLQPAFMRPERVTPTEKAGVTGEAGQYCVNVYDNDFEKLNGAGRLEMLPLDFHVLRNREQYTEEKGLEIQVERGEAVIF